MTCSRGGRCISGQRDVRDGTHSPAIPVDPDQDHRPGGFVDNMQMLARLKLAPIKPSAIGRPADGKPTIAGKTADCEQIG